MSMEKFRLCQYVSGIDVIEKDQNNLTALDLIDAHKSKQKSYTEIKNAIIGRYRKFEIVGN